MSATLKQIARELNLSISTVSRALNDAAHVDADTRRRVLAVATRLNYRPNVAARALRKQATQTMGVVLPDMLNTFYAASTAVLQDQFEQAGYGMILAVTGNDVRREQAAIRRMLGSQVDGIILVPSARSRRHLDVPVPIVEMNRRSRAAGCDSVLCNEAQAAGDVIEHLAGLGHHRVAVIAGQPEFSTTHERIEGVQAAAQRALGHPLPAQDLLLRAYTRQWGDQATNLLLDRDQRPTAIFAASSEVALGVLHACQQRTVDIPDQLSLIAFGSTDWFEICRPPVTSYEQRLDQVGLIAAQLLLNRARADDPLAAEPTHVRVQGDLRIRASTAPSNHPPT